MSLQFFTNIIFDKLRKCTLPIDKHSARVYVLSARNFLDVLDILWFWSANWHIGLSCALKRYIVFVFLRLSSSSTGPARNIKEGSHWRSEQLVFLMTVRRQNTNRQCDPSWRTDSRTDQHCF